MSISIKEEFENEINLFLQTDVYPIYDKFKKTRKLSTIAFLEERLEELNQKINKLYNEDPKLADRYKEKSKMLLTKDELLDDYLLS